MEFLLIAVAGLAVIIMATLFSRRTGVAAPLLLVGLGIGASYVPGMPVVEVPPEWVLAGVLPPLLYASSVRLPVLDFRRNLQMISWLSVVVVLASALAVGMLVHLLFPQIPLAVGVALGAVVSPTDAVAATSIGKRLGLPPRLMTVLEGESLVNDATALVLLRSALAAVAGSFALWEASLEFAQAVVLAIVVGALVGWLTAWLRTRLDDPVLNSAVSFTVPFLAYFPGEELHGSGVLAVVVAGLVTGYVGVRKFSARDRQTEATNWATIGFLPITGWGALVLAWSGMRGAITVAAAQTIPDDVPYRSTVVLTAFVVAVAALVLFGGTLPWVIRRAEFAERSAEDRRAEVTT